jgi:hypothetical protein
VRNSEISLSSSGQKGALSRFLSRFTSAFIFVCWVAITLVWQKEYLACPPPPSRTSEVSPQRRTDQSTFIFLSVMGRVWSLHKKGALKQPGASKKMEKTSGSEAVSRIEPTSAVQTNNFSASLPAIISDDDARANPDSATPEVSRKLRDHILSTPSVNLISSQTEMNPFYAASFYCIRQGRDSHCYP